MKAVRTEPRKLVPAERAKRKWTPEEEYYLQDKWGEVSIKGLAKTLGRSENAVIVRAQRLGLGAHLHADHRITVNQLMLAVYGGKRQGGWTLNRWLENGLPVKKHRVKNSTFRVIDIDDFWKWAEQHKELVDFSRLEENVLGKEPAWVKEKRRIDKREKFNTEPWTPAEDSKLIQLLDRYEYTYHDLSQILNRSEGAIKRRIYDLGLVQRPVRNENKPWTEEETRKLLEMKAKGHRWEEIGRALNRTGSAVRGKYERLQNPEYRKRYYRSSREQLNRYFQKDMCRHFVKTIGCTAGGTNIAAEQILQERYEKYRIGGKPYEKEIMQNDRGGKSHSQQSSKHKENDRCAAL